MTPTDLNIKLDSAVEFLQQELNQIRTGRASPAILEDLPVKAYDTVMTIKEVGTITVVDSTMLMITPWDKSLLPTIAKSIRESELKLNPAETEEAVRVPIPLLSEERRTELTKLVANKVEASKQSVRNIRQSAMKVVDTAFSNKEITEDDKFATKEEFEDIVKEYNKKIEEMGDSKKKALMSV